MDPIRRTVADSIVAEFKGSEIPDSYHGDGSCYIEFGEGRVARADVDFFSESVPSGIYNEASTSHAGEKNALEERHMRFWFGGSA